MGSQVRPQSFPYLPQLGSQPFPLSPLQFYSSCYLHSCTEGPFCMKVSVGVEEGKSGQVARQQGGV